MDATYTLYRIMTLIAAVGALLRFFRAGGRFEVKRLRVKLQSIEKASTITIITMIITIIITSIIIASIIIVTM